MLTPRKVVERLRAWWYRPSLRERLARVESELVRMGTISAAILEAVAASFRARDARLEERLGELHNQLGVLEATLDAALETIGEANDGRRQRLTALVAKRREEYWGGLAATAIGWAGTPASHPEQAS